MRGVKMEIFDKIIKLIKPFVTDSKKTILLLICIVMLQFLIGFLYTRSLKNSLKLAEQAERFQDDGGIFVNKKLTFSQSQIAFLLKGLNISTDELYQHYKPQIDSIKKIATGKENELTRLKTQLQNNPASDKVSQLNQQISFIEQQISFYKAAASYWEQRSKGLRNLVKTLGLDSIMVYLTHQDSINRDLAQSSPPEVVISGRTKETANLKRLTQANQSVAVTNNPSLVSLPFSPEKEVTTVNKAEADFTPIQQPTTIQNQPSSISQAEMRAMLKQHFFFDYFWNPDARGFNNKFELRILNGATLVIDRATRLMWQQGGSSNSINFEAAQKWINDLNQERWAGYDDWRLPTLKEAMTLVEPQQSDLLYIDSLFAKEQNWIWTSDFVAGQSCTWVVSFNLGGCRSGYTLSLHDYYVRAVRSIEATFD